jgi:hypothetical protein
LRVSEAAPLARDGVHDDTPGAPEGVRVLVVVVPIGVTVSDGLGAGRQR